MGRSLKERVQEIEDMNQKIQEENSKLSMQPHFLREEKKEFQRRLSTHEDLFFHIISELRQELQVKEVLLMNFQRNGQVRVEDIPCKRDNLLAQVYRQ